MAEDLGPTTSYSDPFYDRLDALANWIKKSWLLVTIVLILSVVAVLVVTWLLQRHPEAGSAARFVAARNAETDAAREKAFAALAADASVTPAFRARSEIEVVQLLLARKDTATAATAATKAVEFAAQGNDPEVQLVAKLSRAAVHFQAGEYDPALTAYGEAKRASGAKYPVANLEAAMGLARTYERQGKLDDAISELEPLIARTDAGAAQLLGLARASFWDLKRRVAEAKAGTPAAVAPAAVEPGAPAVVVPAVVAPSAPAVAVPALPVAAPAATPAPATK
jgi:Meckel syndrome type 1 protein